MHVEKHVSDTAIAVNMPIYWQYFFANTREKMCYGGVLWLMAELYDFNDDLT